MKGNKTMTKQYIKVAFLQTIGEFEKTDYFTYPKDWFESKTTKHILSCFYLCDEEDLECFHCNSDCDCDYEVEEFWYADTKVEIYSASEISEEDANVLHKHGVSYIADAEDMKIKQQKEVA